MTSGERQIIASARRLPGQSPLLFRAMTACDCGCGLKNRFEFTIDGKIISLTDVVVIDALIEEMKLGREKLWGSE
jgi:hypothetical protein